MCVIHRIDMNSVTANGCSDHLTMIPSYYDMECRAGIVAPVLDIKYVWFP